MDAVKAIFKAILATLLIGASGQLSATPLTENESLALSGQGASFVTSGVGLQLTGAGTITVDIGGPVINATLYWAGRARPGSFDCTIAAPPAGADDELLFAGQAITADRITGCEINGDIDNIGYAADVTDIVSAAGTGIQMFDVSDNDAADLFRLNGAGLLIVYMDPADTNFYSVIVYEGLDFAFDGASPAAAEFTVPVVFNYAASEAERLAELGIFSGDGEIDRPDAVRIDSTFILNQMDGNAGEAFDDDVFPVNVPAGATSTEAELISEPNAGLPNAVPDSLEWLVGVLRIPEERLAALGRMTGGNNIRVGSTHIRGANGGFTLHCDYTLSNNLQVTWSGGNRWHLDKPIDSAICIDDPAFNPVPPAAPFDTFIGEATGKLNGVDGSLIRFTFIDDGEPGRSDYVDIKIWAPGDDPDTEDPVFEIAGFLDGGNIQAHYDQPHGSTGP